MSRNRSNSASNFNQGIKKFFLSAFVVFAFIAYAIHERLINSNAGLSSAQAAPTASAGLDASGSSASVQASGSPAASNSSVNSAPTSAPQPTASNSPATTSSSTSGYKDGTYTGPTVDVNYGLVQVQAKVQNGKITGVQFLQYPTDRRTSQQINAIAVPYLQQEAIQAQSANVDIVSGATLTSEGFQMSLQSALANAH
jgi:uncharacterized protein with FMN-binding domain